MSGMFHTCQSSREPCKVGLFSRLYREEPEAPRPETQPCHSQPHPGRFSLSPQEMWSPGSLLPTPLDAPAPALCGPSRTAPLSLSLAPTPPAHRSCWVPLPQNLPGLLHPLPAHVPHSALLCRSPTPAPASPEGCLPPTLQATTSSGCSSLSSALCFVTSSEVSSGLARPGTAEALEA